MFLRNIFTTNNDKKDFNELLFYQPKITGIFTKEKRLEDVPYEFRKYAQDDDLPIIMFGS